MPHDSPRSNLHYAHDEQPQQHFFSALPIDLIKEISDYGQNPNSEIATALKHAAYARKEDVEAL